MISLSSTFRCDVMEIVLSHFFLCRILQTQAWTELVPLSQERPPPLYSATMTLYSNTTLLLYGGFNSELFTVSRHVWMYDLASSVWTELSASIQTVDVRCPRGYVPVNTTLCESIVAPSNMSSIVMNGSSFDLPELSSHSATLVDSSLVIIGGRSNVEEFHFYMYIFHLDSRVLSRMTQHRRMYTEVVGHSTIWHEPSRSIYVYGGSRPYHLRYAEARDLLYTYHYDQDRWSSVCAKWNPDAFSHDAVSTSTLPSLFHTLFISLSHHLSFFLATLSHFVGIRSTSYLAPHGLHPSCLILLSVSLMTFSCCLAAITTSTTKKKCATTGHSSHSPSHATSGAPQAEPLAEVCRYMRVVQNGEEEMDMSACHVSCTARPHVHILATRADVARGRAGHSGAVYQGGMYVAGGYHGRDVGDVSAYFPFSQWCESHATDANCLGFADCGSCLKQETPGQHMFA